MKKPMIIVATDFSEDAALALEQAVAHARSANARLLIVHVMHVPAPGEGEGMLHNGATSERPEALTESLRKLAESIENVDCAYRLLRGAPAQEILRVAEEVGATTIVMGTHGRSGVIRMLMGSVAEHVIRGAHCSVLVVKPPRTNDKPT